MHLSESGHLFPCTLQLKYTKALLSHTLVTAVLFGMACRNSFSDKLQNRAVRVITKSSCDTSSSSRDLLNSLGWDNLSTRRAKQKANLMYKCTNNLAPAYHCNLFAPRTSTYDLHDAKGKLLLPKPRTDYLRCSFSSLDLFKRSANRWFSEQYSHTANMLNS